MSLLPRRGPGRHDQPGQQVAVHPGWTLAPTAVTEPAAARPETPTVTAVPASRWTSHPPLPSSPEQGSAVPAQPAPLQQSVASPEHSAVTAQPVPVQQPEPSPDRQPQPVAAAPAPPVADVASASVPSPAPVANVAPVVPASSVAQVAAAAAASVAPTEAPPAQPRPASVVAPMPPLPTLPEPVRTPSTSWNQDWAAVAATPAPADSPMTLHTAAVAAIDA